MLFLGKLKAFWRSGSTRQQPSRASQIAEAHALFDGGQYREARAAYLSLIASASSPDEAVYKWHVNVGNCHELLGAIQEATHAYHAALDIKLDCAEAHLNLEALYRRQGNLDQARYHQQQLDGLDLNPALQLRQLLTVPAIADSAAGIDTWRAQFEAGLRELATQSGAALVAPDKEINATTLYLAYQGRNNVELMRLVCATVRRFYPTPSASELPRNPHGRIRIGFVSTFFHNHSIGRLYRGLIGALDREKFEVVVFSIEHQQDETALRIERDADVFHALPAHLSTLVETIRAQQLDVLYYPELGLHPATYFLAYWRLAPVQCMSYGHPETSGIDTIDYFLSGADIEPASNHTHYTEKLVRLDGFFMPAYERPEFPFVALGHDRFGATPDQRVYFCPQTLFKFHPDFDAILRRLLQRDTNGLLVLIDAGPSEWKPALLRRFTVSMSDVVSRVRFIPSQSTSDYVNLLRAAHAVLDTMHFGGGISVMDTLAAAVPIVTMEGPFFRGRQAAACYREMGLEEMIATSPDDYVERAIRLASDTARRQELSARVARENHRLFNRLDSVRALERFLTAAVDEKRQVGV